MNPNDEIHRGRLFKALESSYRALEPFRNLARGLVAEYVGDAYGNQSGPRRPRILNLMHQAADAYRMSLVANRPRALLSTPHAELNYFKQQFQTGVNNLAQEIELEITLRDWVLDALFCVGIIKTHMADAGQVMLEQDRWMDPGMPFASNVSIDNFCFDMGATRWSQVRYASDSYRIPFDDLKEDIYDQSVVRDLTPSSKYPAEGDTLAAISHGNAVDTDELEPMIDLCDVWLARDGVIQTYAMRDRSRFLLTGKPLAVMPWEGPEHGNYRLLGFGDVPENILPTSPFSHISMLDRLINNIMRKQARRAQSAKKIHTYTPTGAGSAKNLKGASDDDFVEVQDPDQIGEIIVGGIDPQAHAWMLGCMELFDRMAGNLTAMMGLGTQADTVGQEQLIHGAVSKKEADMKYRVFDGTRRLFRDLGYLLWNDKFKTMPARVPVEGAEGYFLNMAWTPDDREGSFFDYNFTIDVYSMDYQSPSQRLNMLNQLLTQLYLPALPMITQQGGVMDWAKITETIAELANEPRIKEWIKFAPSPTDPQQGPSMPGGGEMKMPATTNRTYTRRNVPTGGTMASRQHVEQQAWMNGGANQDQKASLGRPAA